MSASTGNHDDRQSLQNAAETGRGRRVPPPPRRNLARAFPGHLGGRHLRLLDLPRRRHAVALRRPQAPRRRDQRRTARASGDAEVVVLYGAADASRTRQPPQGVAPRAIVPPRMKPALLLAALLAATPAAAQVTPVPDPGYTGKREFGRVAFDRYSLIVDGKRLVVWSGEFHPFRLPSPDLWRDILQKMKASGFNTVAFYFDWGYHSPKQGVYDFSGIRDIDRLLTMAAEEGLYVITRAGPYVNAELTRGGFPRWVGNQRARAPPAHPARPPGRPGVPPRRERRPEPDQQARPPPPAERREGDGDPAPDRERAAGHDTGAAALHGPSLSQGARRRHHRAGLQER